MALAFAMSALGTRTAGAQEGGAPGAEGTPLPTPVPLRFALPPSVSLQATPGYGVAPLTVGFYVNAIDPEDVGFVAYQWSFGDGRVSTLPPPVVYNTYNRPGSYLATLTAVTADGRSTTAFAGVLVRPSALR